MSLMLMPITDGVVAEPAQLEDAGGSESDTDEKNGRLFWRKVKAFQRAFDTGSTREPQGHQATKTMVKNVHF